MTINIWITYVIGGLFTLLLSAIAVLLIMNANLRASIAADDATRAVLQSENRRWAESTSRTNAALAKIHAADTANANAIMNAERAAKTAEKKLEIQAAAIGSFSFSGNDCDEVMAVKQAYMEHLR